ncbi:MucB/RseB C-terminal domain-containing protein [Marinobacter sp.]|uniref:MucB/RseB C-terminal domain-containing protein n=1 Tax=Marinobacter sp. TaxID=50741 RepID=UPI002B494958|nr:MucB/RseB C-terminal domain-containing protein [Marinobacter sp.]HKK54930.1 MucB/RseB C-terminal domain-containing protein [Marinobacter sp.]
MVMLRALGRLVLALAVVTASAATGVAAEEQKDPAYWLQKLGPALTKTSYKGVFVYVRGDQVSSMQVAHRFHNGVVEERLVMQDGELGEIVRKGRKVVCVVPEHGRLELSSAIPSGPFSEALINQLTPFGRWYHPEITGRDRIAGHDVEHLVLRARDSLRYSHELWLERSTGLPLKGRVLSGSGEVLEYFHFTSLVISDSLPDGEFEIRTEGREVSRLLPLESPLIPAISETGSSNGSQQQKTEGWTLGWIPDGFHPAAAPDAGSGEAFAFSDGLASFSVFVEPAAGIEMPVGTSRIGATTVYMQRLKNNAKDFLVTVVGEIPLETALKVAESLDIHDSSVLGANL